MTTIESGATIGRLIDQAGRLFESKDFLVVGNERITFADLESRSGQIARGLLADGIQKGERVALLAPNGIEWLTTWSALARIGAVIVAINTFVQPSELSTMIRQSGASRLISVPSFLTNDYRAELETAFPSLSSHDGALPLFLGEAPLLRSIRLLGSERAVWSSHSPADPQYITDEFFARIEEEIVPADPLVVIFTSGSTGPPKGVLHTHGTAYRYSQAILDSYVVNHDDVVFSSMPFFWVGGLGTALLPSLHIGSTVVTQVAFEPGAALDLIERERASIVLGWPQQGRTLADHPTWSERDLSAIRRTSMPDMVTPSQRPPRVRADTLGMTETFGSHSNFDPYASLDPAKLGTSGPALVGMERTIIDPTTGEALPSGAIGEICVRGPFLMAGLVGLERGDVFDADGWYHTGDLGYVDEDDWIYFAGRLGDMIKTSGGANVTPSEVEAALVALPEVLEAYVTGVEAPKGGTEVAAAVVPVPGCDPDPGHLRVDLRQLISAFKVPRYVWVWSKQELPFLDSGKIDKHALEQLFGQRLTARDGGRTL